MERCYEMHIVLIYDLFEFVFSNVAVSRT